MLVRVNFKLKEAVADKYINLNLLDTYSGYSNDVFIKYQSELSDDWCTIGLEDVDIIDD